MLIGYGRSRREHINGEDLEMIKRLCRAKNVTA